MKTDKTGMAGNLKKPRLIFDFVRPPRQRLEEVGRGEAPKESLLGYIQLGERGWPVSASDGRWYGWAGALRARLKDYIEIPSFSMVRQWMGGDIIIIVTRISLVLALTARLLGKKVIFLDAMCDDVPSRLWRRFSVRNALRLADACVCFSSSQAERWSKDLRLPASTFIPLKYFIDDAFYVRESVSQGDVPANPYILSVGRDPKRDFETLVIAADKLNWDLKLVTQAYLVPDIIRDNPMVQVLANLSYSDLFSLYGNASVVVIPVKQGTTHMSGIRATMEAMLLGVPIVASHVTGLAEYFTDREDLVFFEPGDAESLVEAIQSVSNDDVFREKMTAQARRNVIKSYSLAQYTDDLENILYSL